MSSLVTRAQIILLARTLHVAPERLAHLERLGPDHLHELQQRMAAALFEHHDDAFARISRLVPVIPLTISLPLVQRLVPPLLTGRAAGAVGIDHPRKAAETMAMLHPQYAAECAPYMDPRAIGQLADIAPTEPIIDVVNEMLRRRDYVTAGPFLAYATPDLIEAVERGVPDDAGLIFSAAFAYSGSAVSTIVRHFLNGATGRIPRMVHSVLKGPPDLQAAAITVFSRCEPDVVTAVGDILFDLAPAAGIGALIGAAVRGGAGAELLTFTGRLSPAALRKLAGNPVLYDGAVLPALVGALAANSRADSWRGLGELAMRMDVDTRRYVARWISELPDDTIRELPTHATETELWPSLLRLVAVADTDVQNRFGAVWATLSPERQAGLQRHIHEYQMDNRLAAITAAAQPMSMEEVFFRRRRMGRHRGPEDTWKLG
ncbi:hypothetical protein [Nocardia sp. alder85J]|uniref:hypothetical protein n=1 Tax=Nocardia sp. alder85J TaxID=2862949 RepID=UPI001CD63D81|nr:hypothetical protein [Nocardia sp. alder85J]MCX4095018.1 hypothetical protein [Nocardia sp. alder85J]